MVPEFSTWLIRQSLRLLSYSSSAVDCLRLTITIGSPPLSDGSLRSVDFLLHLNSDMPPLLETMN